ncbi:hypothetical protein BX616_010627, partial [Lobosporangium transversale]
MISIATSALALLSAGFYFDGRTRFSRDLKFGIPGMKNKYWLEKLIANNDISLYNRFDDQCHRRPFAPAIVFEGCTYTWRDVEQASNRMAHWYISKGICPKDRVAMYMANSPLFIFSWLALLKIKAVPAFINNQITGAGLIHSLKVVNAKFFVFDFEFFNILEESISAIRDDLGYSLYTITPKEEVLVRFYQYGSRPGPQPFGFMDWERYEATGFPRESRKDVDISDPAGLIFTSGTTGLPKAAVMDHGRCTLIVATCVAIAKLTEKDRLYDCLPLYHTAGAILGVVHTWITGGTVVLARKFSASTFWKEVREQEVTAIIHIGELCRYLLNTPEHPLDKANKVRIVLGNGLRPDVWLKFQDRFAIDNVFEYYSMSE